MNNTPFYCKKNSDDDLWGVYIFDKPVENEPQSSTILFNDISESYAVELLQRLNDNFEYWIVEKLGAKRK